MTLQLPNDHRQIIPRWRNSWVALNTGELVFSKAIKKPAITGVDSFQIKLQSWLEYPIIETASELVSAGLSQGHAKDAVNAAKFLLDNNQQVMPTVLSIAEKILLRGDKKIVKENILMPFGTQELRNKIHNLRKSLVEYPRNALMWVDLSRAYAVVGEWGKASDAMARALILAPLNRFVLRSAARLFMHLDEPDRAHFILAKEVVLRNDPWLLAAEIAISNVVGITSKFIRNSREVLLQKNYHPFHTAELASALATLELSSGASRKARKLFESSLESPTENSVAQSTWAKSWLPTLEVNNAITVTPGTYEARARNAYLLQDWSGVVAASMDWLLDEPFSSRPAVLGSFAAATGLEDYELAVNITRNGLIANPNELGLINNLSFSLANLNKPYEALKELQTASRPAPNPATEVAFKATEGLIDLKLGNWQAGQAKYLDAIALANKESLHKISALASIHYVREMVNIGQLSLDDAISFVEKISSKISDPDVDWLIKRLKSEHQKPK